MRWRGDQRPGIAQFGDAAAIEHHHPVGQLGSDGEVVRDEQRGGVVLAGEIAEQGEDLRLHGDVERRGRLVGDQHARLCGHAHGDQYALALAAGEPVRHIGGDAFGIGQAGAGQPLEHFVGAESALAQLRADAHRRVERAHRILRHGADEAAADVAQRVRSGADDLAPGNADAARNFGLRFGGQEALQGEADGGLARTAFAHQGDDLADAEIEVDAVQHGAGAAVAAQADMEAADRDDWFGRAEVSRVIASLT